MSSRRKKGSNGLALFIILAISIVYTLFKALFNFIIKNSSFIIAGIVIVVIFYIVIVMVKRLEKHQRDELLNEISLFLKIDDMKPYLGDFDDTVKVNSYKSFSDYSDLKYFKEEGNLEKASRISILKKQYNSKIVAFMEDNELKKRPQYEYVENQISKYADVLSNYRVEIELVSNSGTKSKRIMEIPFSRIDYINSHPEILLSKAERERRIKQKQKELLDIKKNTFYSQVNELIDYVNKSKCNIVIKRYVCDLDDLVNSLYYKTVNSIQKIKSIDSNEWNLINEIILNIDAQIHKIVDEDKKISDYYASDEFAKLKETCKLLTDSQREFNEYIEEKAQSITELFGTRVVRNETQHDDVYNYIRAYKKSITPFTAEVSSAVFGRAENNPIGYIIKYFYPNRSQYETQIEKLRVLIEELETLKEAKVIIDNYKKDYEQYIQDVPNYVLDNDENGFYSRLGLAVIDEAVLNVEYKFTYTSDGGFAQRSFTVPMNEENITELIYQLENKLSQESLAKEQRALMTTKLRTHIKERDNYTCCQCGNSVEKEPNLLLEIDHIIPISKGGLTQEDNLQTLCWKCNRSKGSKIY